MPRHRDQTTSLSARLRGPLRPLRLIFSRPSNTNRLAPVPSRRHGRRIKDPSPRSRGHPGAPGALPRADARARLPPRWGGFFCTLRLHLSCPSAAVFIPLAYLSPTPHLHLSYIFPTCFLRRRAIRPRKGPDRRRNAPCGGGRTCLNLHHPASTLRACRRGAALALAAGSGYLIRGIGKHDNGVFPR